MFKHSLWFNNFIHGFASGRADVYMLFGNYPVYDAAKGIKSRQNIWKPVVLAFKDLEMKALLEQVKTKKEEKVDRFFGIGWNDAHSVFGLRGFPSKIDLTQHLLANKALELLRDLR